MDSMQHTLPARSSKKDQSDAKGSYSRLKKLTSLVPVIIVLSTLLATSTCQDIAPNLMQLSDKYFVKEGDLNLGAIYHIHRFSSETLCGKGFSYFPLLFNPHIIQFEVDLINKRDDLLPNITLGYVVLDDCERPIPSIPRMLQLVPLLTDKCPAKDGLTVGTNFEVVGILGPTASEGSKILSTISGFFQIPQIGVFASSDELSDTTRFPYYYRLLPPDRYQARATIDMMKAMGWTYFSLVYIEAAFGYNGNKYIQKWAHEVGVCIEEAYTMNYDFQDPDYEDLLRRMTTNKKARIMIVYLYPNHLRSLLSIYKRIHSELDTELIWILPECFPWGMSYGLLEPLVGSIHITLPDIAIPGFFEEYEGKTPWNAPYDPWIPEVWEEAFGCSFNSSDGRPNCEDFPSITQSNKYIRDGILNRWSDAVHVFAHALDAYIRDRCPEAFRDKSKLKGCVKTWLLGKYVQKVEIQRRDEVIRFDKDGDWLRRYVFKQVQYDSNSRRYLANPIGYYETSTEDLSLDYTAMVWDKYNHTEAPESVCSYACGVGEIMIQGEVVCCWDCHLCRDNEKVTLNMTQCEICPETTWPDVNSTECEPIPPSFLTYSHIYGVGLLSLGTLGFVLSTIAIILIIKHRDRRVIKGASPDMLLVILVGSVLSNLTVPTFILKPSLVWCYLSRAGFSISSTFMFTPLLIKTLRVYRIFAASKKLQTDIYFVSRFSVNFQTVFIISVQIQAVVGFEESTRSINQILTRILCILSQLRRVYNRFYLEPVYSVFIINFFLTSGLPMLVHVVITVAVGIIWPPSSVVRMPIRTEKYAELQCDLATYGVLTPLGYNLFILSLCSVYGLLSRKLPDNFNESWYIFVTVCTTLFIWVAFLPTYFAAFYAYHKAALLSLGVFLSSLIVQLCLFGPKVYALYYVSDSEIKITNFRSFTKSDMVTGSSVSQSGRQKDA